MDLQERMDALLIAAEKSAPDKDGIWVHVDESGHVKGNVYSSKEWADYYGVAHGYRSVLYVPAIDARWGVWCVEDRAWSEGTIGTREHAERELPRWQSGEAAAVNPEHFHYEIRRVTSTDVR